MDSRKMVLVNPVTGQQWICRHKEETHGHRMEEEGGTNRESGMETYTLPYVKQTVKGNLLCDSGNSNQGSVTTERGGMGREVGRKFKREGTLCVPMTDSC